MSERGISPERARGLSALGKKVEEWRQSSISPFDVKVLEQIAIRRRAIRKNKRPKDS